MSAIFMLMLMLQQTMVSFLPMKLMSWMLVMHTIKYFILVLPVRMACMMLTLLR